MAATRATATGHDKSGRMKACSALGSEYVETEAATWVTFVRATVRADGSGYVTIQRDRTIIAIVEIGPERGDARIDVRSYRIAGVTVPGYDDE